MKRKLITPFEHSDKDNKNYLLSNKKKKIKTSHNYHLVPSYNKIKANCSKDYMIISKSATGNGEEVEFKIANRTIIFDNNLIDIVNVDTLRSKISKWNTINDKRMKIIINIIKDNYKDDDFNTFFWKIISSHGKISDNCYNEFKNILNLWVQWLINNECIKIIKKTIEVLVKVINYEKMILNLNCAIEMLKKFSKILDLKYQNNEIIKKCFEFDNYHIVNFLLDYLNIDSCAKSNDLLELGIKYKAHESLKILLKDTNINVSQNDNFHIINCIRNENDEIIELLMNHSNFNGYSNAFKILNTKIKNDIFNLEKTLEDKSNDAPLLFHLILYNKFKFVNLLLKNKKIDPGICNNFALLYSSGISSNNKIITLLLNDNRTDPCQSENKPLKFCIINNNIEMVKLLLDHDKMKVSNWNALLKLALFHNHFEIVELILSCNNSLVHNIGNEYLTHLVKNNLIHGLSLLIKYFDGMVQEKKKVFEFAIKNKRIKCAIILYNSKTLKFQYNEKCYFLGLVCKFGHKELLQLMIKDSFGDLVFNNNYPIRIASLNGHIGIVSLLIKNKSVNPSDNNNEALNNAYDNYHFDIVDLLASQAGVKKKFNYVSLWYD